MSLTINANHSSSYYLRNCYSSNRSAASTDSYRSRSSNHTLVLADSEALKKAAEALSDLDYDDSDEANGGDIYNSITAFVTAYNNFMDSSSSSDYGYIKNQKNHIKDLISEHSSDLESIGITINTKGKLEIDDDADLDARCCGGFDLLGVGLQHLGGKPVFLSALQRFAAQFQEYSLVFHRGSRFIVVRR